MFNILVIDDEPDIRTVIQRRLVAGGDFAIDCASNGYEAAARVIRKDYDCIFLDIMMPGIDGLEVCRRLRASPRTAHIPIIMISALSDEATVRRAVKAGASDYIIKPFSGKKLLKKLRKWTGTGVGEEVMRPFVSETNSGGEFDCGDFRARQGGLLREVQERLAEPLILCRADPIVQGINEVLDAETDQFPNKDLLAADISTAGDLLRMANSVFFGSRAPTVNFSKAFQRLGIRTIGNHISKLASAEESDNPTVQDFLMYSFWSHSLAAACFAEEICRLTNLCDAEELYVAGLFHDVGKLFFASYFPDSYRDMVTDDRRRDRQLSEMENDLYGIDHRKAGSLILRIWHFPNTAQKACFHDLSPAGEREDSGLAAAAIIVSVSNTLSHILIEGDRSTHLGTETILGLQRRLSKLGTSLLAAVEKTSSRVESTAAMLEIDLNLNAGTVCELLEESVV